MCVRRKLADGRYYFIANRGDQGMDGWVPLATRAKSVCIMDPMTGRVGAAACRSISPHQTEVRLNLPPGASVILRAFDSILPEGRSHLSYPSYPSWQAAGDPLALRGQWQVKFLSGGPELPAPRFDRAAGVLDGAGRHQRGELCGHGGFTRCSLMRRRDRLERDSKRIGSIWARFVRARGCA